MDHFVVGVQFLLVAVYIPVTVDIQTLQFIVVGGFFPVIVAQAANFSQIVRELCGGCDQDIEGTHAHHGAQGLTKPERHIRAGDREPGRLVGSG